MGDLWRNPIAVFRLGVDETKPLNSRFSGAAGALTGAASPNEIDGQQYARRMARQDYAQRKPSPP
jgi:hypothetical protein